MGDEMNTNKVEVSPELLERGKSVREYVAATNAVIKELTDRGVEVEFYFNGQRLDCTFSKDFEIRMHLPMEPIQI